MLYYLYILTNQHNKVLYIGVTGNLNKRIQEHVNKVNVNCFTSKYNLKKLIYFEEYSAIKDATQREKQLKKWKRVWKEELINAMNPKWLDFKT